MRKIAVLTSVGDAPGMNAAIRVVVRAGIHEGWEVLGVRNGFAGLMNGEFTPLDARKVGGIIQQGGTILGTARAPQFKNAQGRAEALLNLKSEIRLFLFCLISRLIIKIPKRVGVLSFETLF